MKSRSVLASVACLAIALPAAAQTTTTGTTGTTTGTTGTTTGTTGTTGTTAGQNRVTGAGGGSGFGNTGQSSAAGPFQGTVPASFSGSMGTTTQTNTGGGTGQGISGQIGVPSTYNPWLTTYGNPYAIGQSVLGAGATTKQGGVNRGFGQAVYSIKTSTVGTTAGLQQAIQNVAAWNNQNVSKVPRYTSALSEDIPFVAHPPAELQVKLKDILARSSSIRNGDSIQVVVNGDVVFLVGQVGSQRERRLAESMLRLTPGVGDIDNRLTVPGEP